MKIVQKVLPADVYDALELSAWEFGGIGASEWEDAVGRPLCIHGHRRFITENLEQHWEVGQALYAAGLSMDANDHAVRAINARYGAPPNARVPFNKWCKELNVVRGEA